ncbi:MAG: uridine phosphorylase [Tenericutes bacterium HGW-Tenericutes-1]|jgi:uridine phosphorylase|nr:MAG: uridine phosphorylase [Tenericutes bacterium HGW-Tenericutes-1]PKM57007.1 MAG: uridine phosphorylase [Firmicutes bacterium HGW-Firmicutes-3]
MKPTLYMKCTNETVSPYVIFSGDPWRVEVLKTYLDNPTHVAFSREFNTYTGYYKGMKVTVSSTGIGAPSAAIAMEEMYECGMKVALRMGTVMSLKDELLGHYIVPVGSVRDESTSSTYIDKSYPAVADFNFVSIISRVIKNTGSKVDNGINATMDGYYSQMRESKLSLEREINIQSIFDNLKKNHVSGIDMESACMLVVGRLMNVKTASLTLVTVLENLKDMLKDKERETKEQELCQIALESIYQYYLEENKNESK